MRKAPCHRPDGHPEQADRDTHHPEWPFLLPLGSPGLQREAEAIYGKGPPRRVVHTLVSIRNHPRILRRFGIPDDMSHGAMIQYEDYSSWPKLTNLRAVTIGVQLDAAPPNGWIDEHGGHLVMYSGADPPYILATYRAACLLGTVGYGVLWSPLDGGGHVEERIEGFNIHAPGFKFKELGGAFKALRALAQVKVTGGKKGGDGATWAGGIPDFLEDLWTTLEHVQQATGKRFGIDIMSRQFREKMRSHPSTGTLYAWLKEAKISRKDVEGCRVERSNYAEFVGRIAPYHGH